eukprot:3878484-Rhodomonas_salina.3
MWEGRLLCGHEAGRVREERRARWMGARAWEEGGAWRRSGGRRRERGERGSARASEARGGGGR